MPLAPGDKSAPEAVKFARQGYTIILIGHQDHDEVIGTLGEAPGLSTGRDCRRR